MTVGLILIILGVGLLIVSAVLFILYQRRNKIISVEDFDKKFLLETAIDPTKTQLNYQRKNIAKVLNIKVDHEDLSYLNKVPINDLNNQNLYTDKTAVNSDIYTNDTVIDVSSNSYESPDNSFENINNSLENNYYQVEETPANYSYNEETIADTSIINYTDSYEEETEPIL